jgi:phage shock protein A
MIEANIRPGGLAMLDRFKKLVSGMMNSGISKLETPEILAEQAENELTSSLKKTKQAITEGLTNEKLLEQQMTKNKEQLTEWERRAAKAVEQENDELAKQCLAKKQELNQVMQGIMVQLEQQKKANAALKDAHKVTEEKLREFQAKKGGMIARSQASDAVAKANDLMSSAGSGGGMDKWEQKIREKEAKSEAVREASGHGVVDDQFKALDQSSQVDDELAALKAKMNTKLIVDKAAEQPTKTVVDDNVPMVVEVEEIKPDDEKKS